MSPTQSGAPGLRQHLVEASAELTVPDRTKRPRGRHTNHADTHVLPVVLLEELDALRRAVVGVVVDVVAD